jgi:hypothetical protein
MLPVISESLASVTVLLIILELWDPPTSCLHDVQYMQQNGPFKSRLETALFRATKTCHLANQRGALSHAQRAGSVYKVAVWSIKNNVLDASLIYGFKGISPSPARSRPTDQPGSKPAGRPLIHPRNQHDPTGSKPSTAGQLELPAIPVLRQSSSCPRVQWTNTDRTFCVWNRE